MEKLRHRAKYFCKNTLSLPIVKFLPSQYISKVYPKQKQFRCALVGCGDIGIKNAQALEQAKLAKLTKVYDINEGLASDMSAKFKVSVASTYESLLTDPEIDILILSIPHHLHARLSIQALEADKHVILEKPLARNLSEGQAILAAANQSRRKFSVCFPLRYKLPFYQAKQWIQEGLIGQIQTLKVQVQLKRTEEYWKGGFSGRSESDWRMKKETAGGGVLLMNAVHCLEALRWLFNAELEKVSGLMHTNPNAKIDTENNVVAIFSIHPGILGLLYATTDWPAAPSESIEIIGENGILTISPNELQLCLLRAAKQFKANKRYTFVELPSSNERAIFYDEFCNALLNNTEPAVRGGDALKIQEVIETIY